MAGLAAAGCTGGTGGTPGQSGPGEQNAPVAETVAVQFSEVDPALVDGVSEGTLSNPGAGVAEVSFRWSRVHAI